MSLDDIEVLFEDEDLDIDGPTTEQLNKIYGIFVKDFHRNPFVHKERIVKINTNRSRHPLFRGKYETFVHAITRGNTHNGRREYDRDRANRIHWIKIILLNCEDPRISCFERTDKKGYNQYYYWLQEKKFMVILREIAPALLLVTAFCVDDHNKWQYRKYLDEFRNRRK